MKYPKSRIYHFITTLLTGLIFISARQISAQNISTRIVRADSLIMAFMDEHSIPGMSITVAKGDSIYWSKGYGFADVQQKKPVVSSRSQFRIGSVSKTLTTAALGLLMQRNQIVVDSTVYYYLPEFPAKKYPITVAQVAGHLAGIRSYREGEFLMNRKFNSVREGLELFQNDTLIFIPGEKYGYSTFGYTLLSAVIEKIYGQPFLEIMQNELFDPLELRKTTAEWTDQVYPDKVSFYSWDNDTKTNVLTPQVDNSYKWAGGGFISTTEDIAQFGMAFFGDDFISTQIQHQLMSPQILKNGESTKYGMGWKVYVDKDDPNKLEWVGHPGGSVGGTTMFLIQKEKKIVIVYCINRGGVAFGDLHFKIYKTLFE